MCQGLRAGSRRAQEESQVKRFHVHVSVTDIPASIRFYEAVFA